MLANPHVGEPPLDRAGDQFYTADVFMHTWDLVMATGQDDRLDADLCGQLLVGMEQFEEAMRSSGQLAATLREGRSRVPPASCHSDHCRCDISEMRALPSVRDPYEVGTQ